MYNKLLLTFRPKKNRQLSVTRKKKKRKCSIVVSFSKEKFKQIQLPRKKKKREEKKDISEM